MLQYHNEYMLRHSIILGGQKREATDFTAIEISVRTPGFQSLGNTDLVGI